MAMAACFLAAGSLSTASSTAVKLNLPPLTSSPSPFRSLRVSSSSSVSIRHNNRQRLLPLFVPSASVGGGDDDGGITRFPPSGGGGGDEGKGGDDNAGDKNREEAMLVLAQVERSIDSLPKDLAAAILDGRIPGAVVSRFLELEKSGFMRWLLQFGGFKERLLADDLFLAKIGIECGVGLFTKTAAEYEKRKENFSKELEFVFADVVMAICADFMLVFLPAPTVSLRPALTGAAGPVARFFHGCPDNAFQVAIAGTSYSFGQRLGSILRNGTKLFAVGTASSLIGTSVINALINAKKAVDKSGEVETLPIVSTSVGYGVYMAVSSNLRYQILAGVIEQRILEPVLHQHKLMLSALCFAVRTGNTYLGSLLWVDYARMVGLQKSPEEQKELA
ncbi:Protein RETICULATA-RELATED 4, chloroplastic [Linum grandiflorum]